MNGQTCYLLLGATGNVLWFAESPASNLPNDLLGKPCWSILTAEDGDRLKAALLTVLNDKRPTSLQVAGEVLGRAHACLRFVPLNDVRVFIAMHVIPPEVSKLTERRRQICRLLADGKGAKEIAAKLDLSRKTIDFERIAIASRLGISRSRLAAWCGECKQWL
jgi:DNA-binding NarL/FixJ family response regulator